MSSTSGAPERSLWMNEYVILGGLFGIQEVTIIWEPGHKTGNKETGGTLHSDLRQEGTFQALVRWWNHSNHCPLCPPSCEWSLPTFCWRIPNPHAEVSMCVSLYREEISLYREDREWIKSFKILWLKYLISQHSRVDKSIDSGADSRFELGRLRDLRQVI